MHVLRWLREKKILKGGARSRALRWHHLSGSQESQSFAFSIGSKCKECLTASDERSSAFCLCSHTSSSPNCDIIGIPFTYSFAPFREERSVLQATRHVAVFAYFLANRLLSVQFCLASARRIQRPLPSLSALVRHFELQSAS